MKNLKLRLSGEPCLGYVSKKLSGKCICNVGIRSLISEMKQIMDNQGICVLSAPLVGQNIQLMVLSDNHNATSLLGDVIINPEVIIDEVSGEDSGWESSLITPGIFYNISRPKSIGISFFTKTGVRRSAIVVGMNARIVLQHIDHLNGIVPMCRIKSPIDDIRYVS